MKKKRIFISEAHKGGRELFFIKKVFKDNWIATEGPNIVGFESDLEDYLKEGVQVGALNSGTAAVHLGLILLGVKAGDEVICQTMTFSASANPILYLGATPIFVDSESETLNICPIALEKAIEDRIYLGKKPKAIIAVHLYGMPFKVDAILALSLKYDIPILEDSAEALGSSYKGKKCGTLGEIGILSFNGNKIITTSGGGVIVTKTLENKNRAIFLATQARDNAAHYQHSEVGYNYRMSNICAGIGRGQMEVLESHISLRREMHQFYVDLFENIIGVLVFKEPSDDFFSNFWLTAILVDETKNGGITRETLRAALEVENIESRPLWKPMHLQPIFESYPYYGEKVAETLFEKGLCLPSGSNLSDEDRKRISETVLFVFKKKIKNI
ncbi:pyridoxal phosphate-dependent aminotransferase [Flavobacterium franklandianum]|uniref:Pyridoxal phosphate-dependent aminotransferase n=1 Tax=Flavobacterium franklandianum TaxID=2594430 RepID=A0A553CK47_9FLAO|nr:DegT/DnrJ/EryC1/StrS family aminotransferase [Flavobacterium franklandianum]TRX20876.1 pyridoxal phosphate-dependent aminotransferase [Flavobacterium franklandianum]TRX29456.1 pyridoxal phosphate-dependent aminotransferase [Flavobacterium franklandianum]